MSFENTIFIVFGDNGAEGTDLFAMIAGTPGTRDFSSLPRNGRRPIRTPRRTAFLRRLRANVGAGVHDAVQPAQGYMAEGGIRNGLIVSGPIVKLAPGSINRSVLHVADIMPTLLEVAGASYPKTIKGEEAPPLLGKIRVKLLAGGSDRGAAGTGIIWRGKCSATAPSGKAIGNCAGNTNPMAPEQWGCSTSRPTVLSDTISPPRSRRRS